MGSGGYELALPAGQYRIIASLNDTVFQTTNVTVSNVNIEQDFVLTNSWQGGTREAAIAAAQPATGRRHSRRRSYAAPTPVPSDPSRRPLRPSSTAPAPQPVSSRPALLVWVVPLPNYSADQLPADRAFPAGLELVSLERQLTN